MLFYDNYIQLDYFPIMCVSYLNRLNIWGKSVNESDKPIGCSGSKT